MLFIRTREVLFPPHGSFYDDGPIELIFDLEAPFGADHSFLQFFLVGVELGRVWQGLLCLAILVTSKVAPLPLFSVTVMCLGLVYAFYGPRKLCHWLNYQVGRFDLEFTRLTVLVEIAYFKILIATFESLLHSIQFCKLRLVVKLGESGLLVFYGVDLRGGQTCMVPTTETVISTQERELFCAPPGRVVATQYL